MILFRKDTIKQQCRQCLELKKADLIRIIVIRQNLRQNRIERRKEDGLLPHDKKSK